MTYTINRARKATDYCGGYCGSWDSTEEELNDLRKATGD